MNFSGGFGLMYNDSFFNSETCDCEIVYRRKKGCKKCSVTTYTPNNSSCFIYDMVAVFDG